MRCLLVEVEGSSQLVPAQKRLDVKATALLVVMVGISYVLWNTPVIYPIKVFVVVLHELSHGLAAIATGGEIIKIEISSNIGGRCWTRGGMSFVVASAGYVGSILWGCLIYLFAVRSERDKVLAAVIGIGLIAVAIMYIRTTFGLVFTLSFGAALLVVAYYASNRVADLTLRFLGMTSCFYVLVDIKSDLIDRRGIGSDADAIAEMMGIPQLSIFVGFGWAMLAAAAFAFTLWSTRQAPLTVPPQSLKPG